MNKKMCLKIFILIFAFVLFFNKILYAGNNVIENNIIEDETVADGIKLEYEYNEENNTVLAKIISDIELKDTKPTWKLSKDKKTYTKTYDSNTKYTTLVENINGKKVEVEINITQVRCAKIQMEYEYNEETNIVTAKMVSDIELKNTKPTWKLSEDKKTYTKEFAGNTNYSTPAQDKYGNVINVEINVTEVRCAKIQMDYEYDEKTNTVTAKIISDIELKDTKPTWKLSENKKTYTKLFTSNTKYTTPVEDRYGNIIIANIEVTKVDVTPPEIKLEYKYNTDDTVTIYMKSNEKLGDTKPTWKLSSDKLVYEKTFNTDQDYSTAVKDLYGNTTDVKIKLKKKSKTYNQEDGSKIIVGYMYTTYENVVVQILSSVKMEATKPTWSLSEDGYTFTKTFYDDIDYSTSIQDVNGVIKTVKINVDMFFEECYETGTYGRSGASICGVAGGSNLEYYKFGRGENVFFATFCVHGFEDSWDKDGTVLVQIAENFYNRLKQDKDKNLANKWTIYILKEVNPDGRRLGYTKDGPGRTTLYSKIGKGIDINRSWQTDSYYKRYTDSRNYNGTEGFQAYEAEYLRNFLLSHKSKNGQTVLVDLHGWYNQLIGNEQVCSYYKQQYTSCSTATYGKYGTQYLISWARQNLGAKSALVELPQANNYAQVDSMRLSDKYINATLNMLKGI